MSQLPPCSMLQSLSLYLREFNGEDVGMITKPFSEMVGRGSFGTVYKGEVGHTKVAVKLIDPVSVCSMCSFCAERSAKSEVKKLEKREERNPKNKRERQKTRGEKRENSTTGPPYTMVQNAFMRIS